MQIGGNSLSLQLLLVSTLAFQSGQTNRSGTIIIISSSIQSCPSPFNSSLDSPRPEKMILFLESRYSVTRIPFYGVSLSPSLPLDMWFGIKQVNKIKCNSMTSPLQVEGRENEREMEMGIPVRPRYLQVSEWSFSVDSEITVWITPCRFQLISHGVGYPWNCYKFNDHHPIRVAILYWDCMI